MEQSRPVKNKVYNLTIDSMDRQGTGIARLYGMAVFCSLYACGREGRSADN